MEDYLVSICCITYNHENYIRETINGFLDQKTSFLFEIIIHDDASTDNTQEIIKEYAKKDDRIKPILRNKNVKSKGLSVLPFTFELAKGKYIALCEGDDYWTDPYKLQKQVEFLEKNPDYGLVYTEFNRLNQKTGKIEKNVFNSILGYKINTFEDFLVNIWFLAPLTWVFRSEFLPLIYLYQNENFIIGDLPLLLTISANSNVGFINESTAVYRVLEKSASHSNDWKFYYSFRQDVYKIQKYFAKKYNVSQSVQSALEIKYYETIFIRSVIWGDVSLSKTAYSILRRNNKLSYKYIIFYKICQVHFVRNWLRKYYYNYKWKRS